MITRDLEQPGEGMIVFSETHGLMCRIRKVTEDGFDFDVTNGLWRGVFRGDHFTIPETGSRIEASPSDFREVLSVTAQEHGAWYLENASGSRKLIDRAVPAEETRPLAEVRKENEDRIEELRDAQGWNDASMLALAREFIRTVGQDAAFVKHLESQAEMENGFPDTEDEPDCL